MMDWAEIVAAPIGFWHWWIAAAVFGALEMGLPGIVFLWLCLAAVVNGFLVLAAAALGWTPVWEVQSLTFSVLGLMSVAAGRRLWRRRSGSAHPTLNRRGSELVGRIYPLERPIESGRGRIRLGDTLWLVSGPDLPAGTRVRVTGIDGATLTVEAAGN
ncbi:NfeD family protein [Oleispirillum naphthae]|uniref:NfeD family protein n=1 Tax=Oleispirillum naphthae TaxID=2838853 RepID=UPI00308257E2